MLLLLVLLLLLQISEFLLALLEDAHAMRWASFCK
jgi:hypothetical protein